MYVENVNHKKTAVITGGSGGLGTAMAKRFLETGYNVALVDMNREAGEKAVGDLGKYGPCMFIQFNVLDVNDAPAVFEKVYQKFGSVDVLANNAGISKHRGTTETITEDDWDLTIGINLKGLFFMAKAAAPYMEKSGGGAIVNTCSLRSFLATGDRTLYAISKKAIESINAELAADFWRFGIRVNSVAPGYVMTEMTKIHLQEEGWLENQLNIMLDNKMLVPDDIAEAVLFLASDESIAITGYNLPCVNGLVTMRGKPDESGI